MIESAAEAAQMENRKQAMGLFMLQIGTTLAAVAAGSVWFMSPLALGFTGWPDNPTVSQIVYGAYWLSYFVGLPLLVAGQLGGLVLSWRNRVRAGAWLSVTTLGFLTLTAGTVLVLLEIGA